MDLPPDDRGLLREDLRGPASPHDPGFDDLLCWLDEVLLDEAGAEWGEMRPTWIDVVQVLDSRADLVVPVFRAMRLTGSGAISARDLRAVDREAFVAVGVLAGLVATALE